MILVRYRCVRRAALLATVAIAVAALPTASMADPDDGEPRQTTFEEYIEVNETNLPSSNTIATKLHVPLRLTPANVGTVGSELMHEQQSVTLGDALRNVSGLNVQPGTGVFDYFVVRGFDAENSGLVLVDGAPEPESSFLHTYNIEAVELLKGPGGFLYGKDGLAGVVNVVRKQPLPSDFAVLGARFGNWNSREGSVDWNSATDDGALAFRLNGVWREADNYRDRMESRHTAFNPTMRVALGERDTLSVSLEYVDAEYRPDSGLPILTFTGEVADVPRSRSYQSPADFSDQEISRVQLDYEHRFGDRLTLRNKTYFRGLDWKTAGTIFNGVFPTGPAGALEVSRTLTLLDDEQRFSGNQLELIADLKTGRVKHRLLAGIELSRLDDEYAIDIFPPPQSGFPGMPSIDLLDPVETLTAVTPFPFQAGDTRFDVIAPYVVDQMELSDEFQLLLGARYDDIEFEESLSGFTRDDSDWSPMLGAVWAPTDTLSLYGNSGSSFAPASPRVTQDFDPQESDQLEFGMKKAFIDGRVRTTWSVFKLERENIAIPDTNGITQQTGDQRSEGFEFELAAEPRRGTRLFVAYSNIDSELTEFAELVPDQFNPGSFVRVDRSGNRPAFAPKNLLNLWVSHRFAGGLGIGGGARYIGQQYIDEDNAFEIDDTIILDAAVFYDFSDWRLKVNLRNLSDEEYYTRGFGGTSVIPADPLAIEAGFEFRLQ